MSLCGNKVNAGLLGKYPSLASSDLFQGDPKYNLDFRSVYAGVLENWLKTKAPRFLVDSLRPVAIRLIRLEKLP